MSNPFKPGDKVVYDPEAPTNSYLTSVEKWRLESTVHTIKRVGLELIYANSLHGGFLWHRFKLAPEQQESTEPEDYNIKVKDFDVLRHEWQHIDGRWIPFLPPEAVPEASIIVRDKPQPPEPRYYADGIYVIDRHGGHHGNQALTVLTCQDVEPEAQAARMADLLNREESES